MCIRDSSCRCLSHYPDALEFYYYLAIAYNQAEKPDSVISICKRALEHTTADSKKETVSEFYSILGDMYHTQKQMKEAYACLLYTSTE